MLQSSVLMLNASYEPLNIIPWQKAIRLIWLNKAEVIENKEAIVRSPSIQMSVPSVIRLLLYVSTGHTRVVFNKWNMYFRDDFICQYCGKRCERAELTKDHIIPRSLGGDNGWKNCVTCCKMCNNRKGNRTPKEAGMVLIKKPRMPKESRLEFNMRKKSTGIPEEWMQYLILENPS